MKDDRRKMVALVLLNGEPSFQTFQEDVGSNRDHYFLVAVDGGVREIRGSSLLPDLLIGDMDSLSSLEFAAWQKAGVAIERHPVQKDKTDGQLALRVVIRQGIEEVIFFGALGGRIDQSLANIQLLHGALKEGLSPSIITPQERIWAITGSFAFTAPLQTPFSLLALSPLVSGLSILGSGYDLQDGSLQYGDTLGLSNWVRCSPVRLTAREGEYLLVVSRQQNAPDPLWVSQKEEGGETLSP